MSSIPKTMKALVIEERPKAVVKDHPVPQVEDNELLVKVSHVALNPTDYKHMDVTGNPNSILGCDFSGTIVSLGSGGNNSKEGWKEGDRVCGFVHGGKFPNKGAFAEYVKVRKDMCVKIPDGMGMEDAATFGCAYMTAGMIIHDTHEIPYRSDAGQNQWYLVAGGSSSVGLFAIQLLSKLGFQIITTCSPNSNSLVESYGADKVVDYHDVPKAIEEIKSLTGGGVGYVLECIGGLSNYELSVKSMKEGGGKYATLAVIPDEVHDMRKDVKVERKLVYTVFGYKFEFFPGQVTLPATPKDEEWYIDFCNRSSGKDGLLGKIKPNPVDLKEGGLEGIFKGLELLRKGKVSGKKLVYKIA